MSGDSSVRGAGNRLEDDDSMSGNAIMFDAVAGKVLTIGGSEDNDKPWATNHVPVITLGEPGTPPDVRPAGEGGMMHRERVFHTSVVFPDGRVLSGGGALCGNCSANHYDGQIFTPPYLLSATGEPRPRFEITERLPRFYPGFKECILLCQR